MSTHEFSKHEPLDLADLNDRHTRNHDKWYRMFVGAASRITAFEGGVIHLDIQVDNRLEAPFVEITHKIACSWLYLEELAQARGYEAHLQKGQRPSGFVLDLKNGMSRTVAEEIVRRARELSADYPDVLITSISGAFQVQ